MKTIAAGSTRSDDENVSAVSGGAAQGIVLVLSGTPGDPAGGAGGDVSRRAAGCISRIKNHCFLR